MDLLTSRIENKKAEIAAATEAKAAVIQSTKDQLLNAFAEAPAEIDTSVGEPNADLLNSIAQSTEDTNKIGPPDVPIAEQQGNISRHIDGTYTVRTAEGKVVSGLSELDAKSFAAYNQENARATAAGAPTSFVGNQVNEFGQNIVNIGETAASAFTTDPENLKAIADFSQNIKDTIPVNRRDLYGAVTAFKTIADNKGVVSAVWNAVQNDLPTLLEQGVPSIPYMVALTLGGPTTQMAILSTLAIGKGNQAVEEFTKVNKRRPDADETFRIKAYSAVAQVFEKYGDVAAVRAIPGRFSWMKGVANQVRQSTPPSVLNLTVFRPLEGLLGEALSGGLTATAEQLAASGKITDTAEIGFASLAEMVAVPGGIAGAAAGKGAYDIAAVTLKKLTTKALTPEEEKVAQQQEILTGIQTKIDSEDPGTIGDTKEGDDIAQKIQKIEQALASATDETTISNLGTEKQTLIDRANVKLTGEESVVFKAELTKLKEAYTKKFEEENKPPVVDPKKGTTISKEEFDETIATLDFIKDPVAAVNTLMALGERVHNVEQGIAFEGAKRQAQEALKADLDKQKESDTLFSFQEVAEGLDPEEVDRIQAKHELTPLDRKAIKDGQEAKQLAQELTRQQESANIKSMDTVHEEATTGSISSRWTGLKTYSQEIYKILKDEKDQALANSKIAAIEAKMNTHAANLNKKLNAFIAAQKVPRKSGEEIVVKGVRVSPNIPSDRSMKYTVLPAMSTTEFNRRRNEGEFLTSIHKNSGKLLSTLTKEVAYSKKILAVVKGYKNTSFKKSADKLAISTKAAQELSAQLGAVNPEKEKVPIDQEAIDKAAKPIDKDPHQADVDAGTFGAINETNTDKKAGFERKVSETSRTKRKTPGSEGKAESSESPTPDAQQDRDSKRSSTRDRKSSTTEKGKSKRAPQLTKEIVLSFGTTEVALQWLIDNTSNKSFRKIAQVIQGKIGKNIPITFTEKFKENSAIAGRAENAEGVPTRIVISRKGLTEATLLHEILHHAVTGTFNAPKTAEEKAAVSDLHAIAAKLRDILNDPKKLRALVKKLQSSGKEGAREYTLTRTKEYIARISGKRFHTDNKIDPAKVEELLVHGLTSVNAQEILQAIDAIESASTSSLWSDFSVAIRKLLGIPSGISTTLFDQVLESGSVLLLKGAKKRSNQPVNFDELNAEDYSEENNTEESFEGAIDKQYSELVTEEEFSKKERFIPKTEHSKQAFRIVFSEEITKDNKVKANTDSTVLATLSKLLGVEATIDEINGALDKLPNTKNFIEGSTDTPTVAITNKQLAEAKEVSVKAEEKKNKKPYGKVVRAAKLAHKIASNAEATMKILGKAFLDLVGLNTEAKEGIHTLPNIAFTTEKYLITSLIDIGTSEKSAAILSSAYFRYKARYDKINFNNDTDTGNYALHQPLSILYQDNELPPQVLFSMMLGTLNWTQRNPTSNPLKSEFAREMFLYGGKQKLSTNEETEIKDLGHSYQQASNEIGITVTNILNLSPKDKSVGLYFDKLIPALGLLAVHIEQGTDAEATFRVEEHSWNFARMYSKDRIFNNRNEKGHQNTYKHILHNNAPIKFNVNQLTAIEEIAEAIDVDINTEGGSLLKRPSKRKITSVRNSFGGVPKKVTEVITKLQNVKWDKAETVDIVAALNQSHRSALESLIGTQSYDYTDHEDIRGSREASNRDKTDALDRILEANTNGDLEGFYFTYALQNHHRIMMQGDINPQQSKVDRWLVKPFKAVIYNASNVHLFKMAAAANLGFAVDKNAPEAAIEAFEERYNNEDVQTAIKAIQDIQNGFNEVVQLNELARVLPVIQSKFGGNMSILNALTGLSKYKENDTFTSDIVFEIDGITNGFAINVMQFPMFTDEEGNDDIETQLNRTGTYIGNDTRHKTEAKDTYQRLAELIKKYSGVEYANETELGYTNTTYTRKNTALEILFPDLKNGDLRDLVKYPFLIFMYGGGTESISQGVAKNIVDDIYDHLNTIQKTYNAMPGTTRPEFLEDITIPPKSGKEQYLQDIVVPFASQLTELNAFKKGYDTTSLVIDIRRRSRANKKIIESGKYKEIRFEDKKLIETIGKVLAPRFDLGLNEMLGGTGPARQAIISGGEVLHAIFMAHYNKAEKALLATMPGRTALTKREVAELVKSDVLIKVLPQYKGYMSSLDSEDTSFVDLSSQIVDRSDTNAEKVEVWTKGETKGKPKRLTGSANQTKFDSPGVAALIRMIINIDATLLTLILNQHPNTLMLHDAYMGSPVDLVEVSKGYGRVYTKIGRTHSIMQAMVDQIAAVKELSSPAIMSAADRWIKKEAYVNRFTKPGESKTSIYNLITDVENANINVFQARQNLEELISEEGGGKILSNQMYMGIYDPKITSQKPAVNDVIKTINDLGHTSVWETKNENKPDADILESLSNLPRSNETKRLVGDIDSKSIHTLNSQFKKLSSNYYANQEEQNTHSTILDKVLGVLAKGLNSTTKINLTWEDIDGITQGQWEGARNAMRISLSRQVPDSANTKSPQEVYVHETLHAITRTVLKNTPLIAAKVNKLFHEIKNEMGTDGYKVFLSGLTGPHSAEDIALAKKTYVYVFKNTKNEANRLDEFLAHALTNKEMIHFLSNRIPTKKVRDKTILGRLLEVLDLVVATFERILQRGLRTPISANQFHEMLAVLEHLVAIQSKHQSQFQKLANKGYKFLDETDQKIKETFIKHSSRVIETVPTTRLRKVISGIAGAPTIIMSDSAAALAIRQQAHETLNDTLKDLANEIGGGALSKVLIEQLLHAKVNISKGRHEAERFTTDWFNSIWKSVDASKPGAMPVKIREALTNILLRTDLSSLRRVGLTSHAISQLINNPNGIKIAKRDIHRKLGKAFTYDAREYTDALGKWIITGKRSKLHNQHTNVYTIARQFLGDTSENTIMLLDAYATLEALTKINSNQGGLVKDLANAEFAQNSTENGFIDMLDSHLAFKDKSIQHLFKHNPSQIIKGYIVERVDDLTNTVTGKATDAEQMRIGGYTESYPIGKIPGIAQTHDTIYVSRTMPDVPFVSGMMSTSNQRNKGTTLTEIFMKDPGYLNPATGKPDIRKINKDIQAIIKRETSFGSTPSADPVKLIPVRNDRDKITDYRVMMDHETKRELLKPDLEIQNVFAHMESRYVDRKYTISSDKKIIESLVHEQQDLFLSHPKQFINFLDPNSKYADQYRNLPREVRDYIDQFAVNGVFMIRRDIINKVFGFKAWDLSELSWLQKPSMNRAKYYVRNIHHILRQVVGYGKDRIVIAMPQVVINNIRSNVYQLLMKKIPLPFIVHKAYEGYKEYVRYRDDNNELNKLKHLIATKPLPNTHPTSVTRAENLERLRISISNNRIHAMSAAGVNSIILEGLNEASSSGYFRRVQRMLKFSKRTEFVDKIPTKVSTAATKVATTLFFTKSSEGYQFAHQVVQLTDFLARYVMIEHLTLVKGMQFKPAMHIALDSFVLFDENLTPIAEAIEAIGGTSFLSYFLRNQRSSRQLVQSSPTGVGLSAATQYLTGVETLGNLNSAWVTGDISPNYLQFDDLADEATSVTGGNLILDFLNNSFN